MNSAGRAEVKPRVVPFWSRCTTHFGTYFSGDGDVHRGYDLDVDPWPYEYKQHQPFASQCPSFEASPGSAFSQDRRPVPGLPHSLGSGAGGQLSKQQHSESGPEVISP